MHPIKRFSVYAALALFLCTPAFASAQTATLSDLQSQLNNLLQQLNDLLAQSAASTTSATNPQNATFSASPTSGSAPLTVTFTGGSLVSAAAYGVSFGDGANGTFTTPAVLCPGNCASGSVSHTYTAAGTYTARLQSDPCPGRACLAPVQLLGTTIVNVGTSTSAGLSITGLDAPTMLTILQSGAWTVHATSATSTDLLKYAAVWGDATSTPAQTSSTFTHAYGQAGIYKPTFTVTDASTSDSANASASVMVSEDENSGTSTPVCPTLTRTLVLGSTDATTDGEVTMLQQFLTDYFNLDGSLVVGTFGKQTQQYVRQFQRQNGISAVGFVGPQTRAAMAKGCGGIISKGPFSASPTSGTAPLQVIFTLPNQSGMDLDFGDGATSTFPVIARNCECIAGVPCTCPQRATTTVSHTYTSVGTYTALLTQTTGGVACGGISYDPNNPISFMDLNKGSGCVERPLKTILLGKAVITVSATSTAACGVLTSGSSLVPGQSITSCNGTYNLKFQTDGNVVLYHGTTAIWSTGTDGLASTFFIMQTDGNLVLYKGAHNRGNEDAVWASGSTPPTRKSGGGFWGKIAKLLIQDDGNLVVTATDGTVEWASGTTGK